MMFTVSSTQQVAHCPLCQCPSQRIHSRYERTLKDLPLVQFSLTILLEACKFFCQNESCVRRIFTERLPAVVAPWARRTIRYHDHLKAMGLTLGGSAATRLSHQLNYGHSRNKFLNLLSSLSLPVISTPKVLGVDDFALRKGHHYGTILVDRDQHCPIALLPDRSAETLETWLKEHPGIEILSRDRAKTYKRGMSNGAPNAIQVADRFHLLQNLEEALEKDFKGKSHILKSVERAYLKAISGEPAHPPEVKEAQHPRRLQRMQKRAERLKNYEQTHTLRNQGYRVKDIAHHLGIGERTVYTYLSHPTFPEWQPTVHRRRRGSQLDTYKPYLNQQWEQGRHSSKTLFEDIQQQG